MFSTSHSNEADRQSRVYSAVLQEVYDSVEPYIQSVEAQSPGHSFGRRVLGHMVSLRQESAELAKAEGLSPHEGKLLGLALAIHDIGRIICQAERPDDRAFQHQHGAVGAEFLRTKGLLSALAEADAKVLLDVVEQHSTKDVTLTPGSLSHRICYVARDLDKAEILSKAEDYLSPKGALKQLSMWMLTEKAKTELENLSDEQRIEISQYLNGMLTGTTAPGAAQLDTALKEEIYGHLVRPIPPEYLEKVSRGELLSKEEMISGYPAYALAQIAMANDVKSPAVKQKILDEGLLSERIAYLGSVAPNAGPAVSEVTARLKTS